MSGKLPRKKDLKRNQQFLDLEKLAEAAGISAVTLRKTINHIEKQMGFKPGDIAALREMSLNGGTIPKKPRHNCPECGKETTRKSALCKQCETDLQRSS